MTKQERRELRLREERRVALARQELRHREWAELFARINRREP